MSQIFVLHSAPNHAFRKRKNYIVPAEGHFDSHSPVSLRTSKSVKHHIFFCRAQLFAVQNPKVVGGFASPIARVQVNDAHLCFL
jgi:hypothetical protein